MKNGALESPIQIAQLFVSKAPLSMTMLDMEGRLIAMSPLFRKAMLGASQTLGSELIGKHVAEVYPQAAENIAQTFEQLERGESPVERDKTIMLGDGQAISMRTQGSYWRDDDGTPIGVLFVHHDISAEVAAHAARMESEAHLRALIDHLPAQVSLMNLDTGRVALLNAKMIEGLAAYGRTVVGSNYEATLDPKRKMQLETIIARAATEGGSFEDECCVDKGAHAGRIMRVKHVIFNDQQNRRFLLWYAEDITELRAATEAFRRAAAEAEACNRAKSEFLANMSHEIRTPLNGVMGVASALARTSLAPPQREMVGLIQNSAETLETLLSDILDLARIEAGRMEIRPEPFDLASSINACSAPFDAAAQAKGLDLEVKIAPEALGSYLGDAVRIRQIIANLVGNAVKFTQRGHVRLTVAAHQVGSASQLRFDVEDSGIGFSDEVKARLFSRFEQADGSITRQFGGSGLGLAISRSLAEAMGGELSADAEEGVGAVFTLRLELPRCEREATMSENGSATESDQDTLAGVRVLLAEDHPVNRKVVQLILGSAGVDLVCVENGAEAVEAFRSKRYDLVLMDMQMPVMDGLTAIGEIRKLEAARQTARTPIVVLTANAMPEHVSASTAAGADGHLSKPIVANALLGCVTDATATKSLAAAAEQAERPQAVHTA